MNIQDIRQKYPQYKDISDQQLADAFHDKFYSDMPKSEFYSKIGFTAPQQPTTPTPAPKETVGGELSQAVGNIIPSAVGVGQSIATAVRHPVDTARGLVNIAAGALQSALAPESFKKSGDPFLYSKEAETSVKAAKDFYVNRYGSLEKAKQAFIQDPVGVAMDLSSVAGIGGTAAKLSGLSKTAMTLGKVSHITDPVRQVGKVAKGIVRPTYAYSVGLATGSGAEVIKQALKGGDAFTQAMRGHISETDVLDSARDALQSIKDERGAAYRSQLEKVKGSNKVIDISDVRSMADDWLKKYNIRKTPEGELDFSRSTLRANPTAANEVKSVYSVISDYFSDQTSRQIGEKIGAGKKPGLTPIEMDTLKRTIADSYSSTQPSRAMVQSLRSAVNKKIVSAIPEYAKMTKDYAKASDYIDDIERGLSLTDKAATDTALRKLQTAMREEGTFRRSMIDELTKRSGTDVAGAVAGLLMKNPWTNRLGPIAHFYGTSAIAAYAHSPKLLGLLPAASPRFMGEVSRGIGKAAQAVPKNRAFYMAPYQAGRLPGLYDDSSLK